MKHKSYLFSLVAVLFYVSLLWLLVFFESRNATSNIKNLFDAFWYSVVTLTTVGYGDRFPITLGGRIVSIVFLLSSVGILGYIVGSVTNKIKNYMENLDQSKYISIVRHLIQQKSLGKINIQKHLLKQQAN